MGPIAEKCLKTCQALKSPQAQTKVISFGRVLSRAATSKIETGERQLFNNLKPLFESVAAYNKYASKVSEPEQLKSLERLKRNAPPELSIITAIGQRKLEIIGLKISMMPSSDAGVGDASQQHVQLNSTAAVNDAQLQDIALNNRQADNIDSAKVDIFECQENYLEPQLVACFDHHIINVSFSQMGKNLLIHGCNGAGDFILKIWRQDADGNWLQQGEIGNSDSVYRCELNRSENTLLSCSYDGNVKVCTLNSDGRWEEAVVLALTPYDEDYPRMEAGFSPGQNKIMSYDPQNGKINVLRQDSNGRWIPLTQPKEILHYKETGPQQPPLKATNDYFLTYQGSKVTIWACNDESNCLEEKKVFECVGNIASAQLSDDEQHAVIFTWGNQTIFLGCDVDGNWSQIGEICHPATIITDDNQHITNLVCRALFNATGHYALTKDIENTVIVSGYNAYGVWEGKAEIRCCSDARFSPSGGKILARFESGGSFKLLDCKSPDDRLDQGQTFVHHASYEALFSPSENLLLSYGYKSNFACIWGDDEEGNLVENARLYHLAGIDYAAFNAQEDSVLTRGSDWTVKIHGLNSQGKWQEELEFKHLLDIREARFSSSGRFAYTFSRDTTASILGRDDNGKWTTLAVTKPGAYAIHGAHFNELENHFVTYGNKKNRKDTDQSGLVQLWGIGDDGTWVVKDKIKTAYPVQKAKFSPDSEHLVIHCNDDLEGPLLSKAGIAFLWKIPASPVHEMANT
ncbi:WD40 repeat domain-containing protein [Thalassotalea sp. G20_0]|uniref:WD40 repeat domain-containing protein n=1 Tax=Thalassotalea sp. G20_0 TaxID=2821093 RepID=UPI001ADC0BBE|nr:WD40 repeat domain-containing protein [Thalassotalea sp. G20_0]MBO9495587.1 WD40 repeat domain-containing protein [Thalassotalea sp. G20_0]